MNNCSYQGTHGSASSIARSFMVTDQLNACGIKKKDSDSTTSHFIRHLKKHPDGLANMFSSALAI